MHMGAGDVSEGMGPSEERHRAYRFSSQDIAADGDQMCRQTSMEGDGDM
jgi:hypothetical protein